MAARALIETGLREWIRCCAPALRDNQMIGMPSHAVDEARHGLILCTVRNSESCEAAYGRFLHHHPDGGGTGRRLRRRATPPVVTGQRRSLVKRDRRCRGAAVPTVPPGR